MNCTIRRATELDAPLFVAWRAQPSVREFQPIEQRTLETMADVLKERAYDPLNPNFTGKVNWVVLADEAPAG